LQVHQPASAQKTRKVLTPFLGVSSDETMRKPFRVDPSGESPLEKAPQEKTTERKYLRRNLPEGKARGENLSCVCELFSNSKLVSCLSDSDRHETQLRIRLIDFRSFVQIDFLRATTWLTTEASTNDSCASGTFTPSVSVKS
jgi:hypothetical protein